MAKIHNKPARSQCTLLLRMFFALSLTIGCASPWLDSYDHEETISCRIDNPDRDNLWDTSDTNGNGVIDDNETIGPVFDMAALRSGSGVGTSSSTLRSDVRISSPGFREDFNVSHGNVAFNPSSSSGGISANLDYGDLHTFNTGFAFLNVRPHTETYGIQIVRSHSYSRPVGLGEDFKELSYFQFSYGARYHRLREAFTLDGLGGILGSINANTVYDNELLGPQIAFELGKKLNKVDLQLGSSIMSGLNLANRNQYGSLGLDRFPGVLNQAGISMPNVSVVEQDNSDFASLAEIHAQLAMPLSGSSTFRFGYTTLYFSHLRHVDTAIDWTLPDFSINSSVTNDTWVSGLHASVEWRR